MKRFTAVVAFAVAAFAFTGCATTNDGRTGLRGELCAFGYCVVPSAMSASAVPVVETANVGTFGVASTVAPATVVSQPAVVAAAPAPITTFGSAAACAPGGVPYSAPAPAYAPPPPQLTK